MIGGSSVEIRLERITKRRYGSVAFVAKQDKDVFLAADAVEEGAIKNISAKRKGADRRGKAVTNAQLRDRRFTQPAATKASQRLPVTSVSSINNYQPKRLPNGEATLRECLSRRRSSWTQWVLPLVFPGLYSLLPGLPPWPNFRQSSRRWFRFCPRAVILSPGAARQSLLTGMVGKTSLGYMSTKGIKARNALRTQGKTQVLLIARPSLLGDSLPGFFAAIVCSFHGDVVLLLKIVGSRSSSPQKTHRVEVIHRPSTVYFG